MGDGAGQAVGTGIAIVGLGSFMLWVLLQMAPATPDAQNLLYLGIGFGIIAIVVPVLYVLIKATGLADPRSDDKR